MPLYEYTCRGCEATIELLVHGSQKPVCPGCGSGQLEKLLSVPAAHRRGGGELPICEQPNLPPCGMGGCGRPECG